MKACNALLVAVRAIEYSVVSGGSKCMIIVIDVEFT